MCILGGGTAGFIAAAHLSRRFPGMDLTHIYSSAIPPIGVGEGTTPPFRHWIHEMTGLELAELRARCGVTHKDGIRFEGWGRARASYTHYFAGREGVAYHISADLITELLGEHTRASHRDARVTALQEGDSGATVELEDGTRLGFDLVIDARGFPRELDPSEHEALSIIPTNAAMVRRSQALLPLEATRAVARAHGWIFVIPLGGYTSYGYVHNNKLSSLEAVTRRLRVVPGGGKCLGSG